MISFRILIKICLVSLVLMICINSNIIINLTYANDLSGVSAAAPSESGKAAESHTDATDFTQLEHRVEEPADGKPGGSSGSSSGSSIEYALPIGDSCDLRLEILSDPTKIYRNNILNISYNLSNPTAINFSQVKLFHKLPSFFKVVNTYTLATGGTCNVSNQLLTFNCSNLNSKDFMRFGYSAIVVKNAKVSKYNFENPIFNSDQINNFEIALEGNNNINILNNDPKIYDILIKIDDDDDYPINNNNTYTLSKTQQVIIICKASDTEDGDDKLHYLLKSGEEILVSCNNGTISWDTNFGTYKNISLTVFDKDNGACTINTRKTFDIKYNNREEYFWSIFTWINSIFLLSLLIIISIMKERLAKGFLWIASIIAIIFFYFLIGENISRITGIVELFILFITILFTNKFIITCFSNNSIISANKISKNSIITKYKNNLSFKNYKQFCKNAKIFLDFKNISNNVIKDYNKWRLWYFTIAAMVFVEVVLVIYIVPNVSDLEEETLLFNYIFYYYTMMTQTFGAIVAIVAMIATSSIYIKKNINLIEAQKELDVMENKIKNFMYLHVSIIILSIIGLALRALPPLQQYNIIKQIQIVPLFIFEVTLLLAIPALTCLVKFVLDYFKFRKEELLPDKFSDIDEDI